MNYLSRTKLDESVDHDGVRLDGRGRIVESVRVLRRLALQLTLVG